MVLEKFKIIVENDGVNHIKIFKKANKGFVNDWNFTIKEDEPIVFKDFFSESKFVLVGSNGRVQAYDAITHKPLFGVDLNADLNAQAVFSLDKSKLYVAYKLDSNEGYLTVFDLHALTMQTLELSDIYNKTLDIRNDGTLLFYKHDWERINNVKTYKHFYSTLDLNTGTVEQYELPFAPQFSFGSFKPVVDIENNRAIMPVYDEVVHKTKENGDPLFEFRLFLLNLTTFETTHLFSVRDFPKDQLGYYEYECEEMAEQFLSPKRSDDYDDALRTFYENLNTIKVVKDGIWLCWRGGILRKVTFDFNLSPLLVTSTMPTSTLKGMFTHTHFHSNLYQIDDSLIVFEEGLVLYKTPMPNWKDNDIDTPIALQLDNTDFDDIYQLSYSKDQYVEIETRNQIKIQVADLSSKDSYMSALTQMEKIVSSLETQGIGSVLIFTVSDTQGSTLHEPEFFAQAVVYAPEQVKTIIEKFNQYKKAKYLYGNPEKTALCHAVFELAKTGGTYLTTVLRYLSIIDLDHDVFNRENLLPYLEETYSLEELARKMEAVSEKLAEWYICYKEE